MSREVDKKPTPLVIDVEQWKRDIQTFAQTTSRALNAIGAELSNDCSQGHAQRSIDDQPHSGLEECTSVPTSLRSSDSQGEQRLARLKSMLAERICNPNEPTESR